MRPPQPKREMHDPLIAHRSASGDTTVVVFAVAGDCYAVPAACTREVLQWRQPRRLPGAPSWVEGVVNLRGSIIPVCDLANALDLRSERPRTEDTSIIIVEAGPSGELAGFTVDEVRAVTEFGPGDVLDTSDADYPAMAGIVRAGEGDDLVVILDVQRALAGATSLVAAAPAHAATIAPDFADPDALVDALPDIRPTHESEHDTTADSHVDSDERKAA